MCTWELFSSLPLAPSSIHSPPDIFFTQLCAPLLKAKSLQMQIAESEGKFIQCSSSERNVAWKIYSRSSFSGGKHEMENENCKTMQFNWISRGNSFPQNVFCFSLFDRGQVKLQPAPSSTSFPVEIHCRMCKLLRRSRLYVLMNIYLISFNELLS
jgi:hypothetical protein